MKFTVARVESILAAAVELPSAQARQEFIEQSCSGDADLKRLVEELVENHFQAGSFLERPALAATGDIGTEPPGATPSDLTRARELFLHLVDHVPVEEWDEHLAQVCGEDTRLAEQVNDFLLIHRESDSPSTLLSVPEKHATIGPYQLIEQLGEGGMGSVWMAEQTHPVRRMVALKLIKSGMDSRQVIARFEAERQALALMDHPNIARVLDAGTTQEGQPYFVMELVKGVPITEFCDQNHLTPQERLHLFVSVCQAVQHAHTKGLIHRDIKPSNVLVTLYDGKPVAKVIDFGVAKATGPKLTEKTLFTGFGAVVGTPEYMSPEQAELNQLDIDTRSDIYSLGVLLYELLTGTTPMTRKRARNEPLLEVLRIIREEEVPLPSARLSTADTLPAIAARRGTEPTRLRRMIRGELDWIVMKALDKDRNRRYETANAFAMDVQRFLNDEPVHACPPARWYRFGKFARRNRRGLATAAFLALAALVAVAILADSNRRITQETTYKTKALEAAKTSEQEAVESLKDALDAVDKMLTRVSEERLRDIPLMEPVRRELLEDALKFYQKFLARRGNHPAIRLETALAYRRMASLYFGLGDYRKSEDAYREAFALLDELHAERPLDISIRSELVSHYIGFSWVLRNQGKFDEGEKALRRAVAIAEDLVKESPQTRLYQGHLVDARNRLAYALINTQPDEAERLLRRNLTLTRNTETFSDRAQTYRNLGYLRARQHRFSDAEDACRMAALFVEKALTLSPHSRWLQVELAGILKQHARMVELTGQPEEAEQICQRAIPLFDKFASDFPAGPHNRWGQADIHFQHALLLHKLKRLTEAEQAYRRTVVLFDQLVKDFPKLPGYRATAVHRRLQLAQFLAETGRAREAQWVSDQTATILTGLPPSDRSQALTMRGYFYAGAGEWSKAAADWTKAIELGSEDVLGVWCPLALVQLGTGNTQEYRALCDRMLARSESHWVVGVCTLVPNAVTDLTRPVRIAEKLVAREPTNADYITLLGFALYRNGDLESAVQRLEVSLPCDSQRPEVQVAKLILAMAYQRLGRGAEAQQLIRAVTGWMQGAEKFKDEVSPGPALVWAYRLGLQLLYREAEQLVKQDCWLSGQKSAKSATDPDWRFLISASSGRWIRSRSESRSGRK